MTASPSEGEHGGVGDILLHELETHEAVIHFGEARAGKFNHLDLDALAAGEVIEQEGNDFFRITTMIKGGVNEVDADAAQGFLLAHDDLVQQPHMDDDLGSFFARLGLELDAQPAMAVGLARNTVRSHGIGKNKKSGLVPALFIEPLEKQTIFVIQHGLQALAADVTIGRAVNGVAHPHVVGGNGLGDCAGRAARVEETARDLLARPDFGKGAVLGGVEVDLVRLLAGAYFIVFISVGVTVHLRGTLTERFRHVHLAGSTRGPMRLPARPWSRRQVFCQ